MSEVKLRLCSNVSNFTGSCKICKQRWLPTTSILFLYSTGIDETYTTTIKITLLLLLRVLRQLSVLLSQARRELKGCYYARELIRKSHGFKLTCVGTCANPFGVGNARVVINYCLIIRVNNNDDRQWS